MALSPKAWKLIAESKIEQAIREGEFDDLPGFGEPLNFDVTRMDENWWLKAKAKRENLSMLPPALVLRREVQRKQDRIMQLKDEAAVRDAIRQLNDFIISANLKILWGPPSEVLPLNVEALVEEWKDVA